MYGHSDSYFSLSFHWKIILLGASQVQILHNIYKIIIDSFTQHSNKINSENVFCKHSNLLYAKKKGNTLTQIKKELTKTIENKPLYMLDNKLAIC